jgi:Protein of unknown function (DUF2384)
MPDIDIEDWGAVSTLPAKPYQTGLTASAVIPMLDAWVPEKILTLAEKVFGDNQAADKWLTQPNLMLDNKAPIDLLDTPAGFNIVRTLLLRIEYGVLA